MKLGTKLFLFVGAILLVICVAIYFVPIYVSKKQEEIDTAAYLARQKVRQEEAWERRLEWIVGELAAREGVIDAFLYFVATSPTIQSLLSGGEGQVGVWLPTVQLFSYTNMIDMIQVRQRSSKVAAMGISNRYRYWSYEEPITEAFSWIALDSRYWQDPLSSSHPVYNPRELVQYAMIGIRLPNASPLDDSPTTLQVLGEPDNVRLFFDPKALYTGDHSYADLLEKDREKIEAISYPLFPDAGKNMEKLLEQLASVQAYLRENFKSEEELSSFLEQFAEKSAHIKTEIPLTTGALKLDAQTGEEGTSRLQEEQIWKKYFQQRKRSHVLDMAWAMAYYASVGAVWETPLDSGAALGAAYIVPSKGQGGAVFARDVFSTQMTIDDEALFEQSPPAEGGLPIFSGFVLVNKPPFNKPAVTNSLQLVYGEPTRSQGYLSVGSSSEPILTDLYTLTQEHSLLIADGKIASWAGYRNLDRSSVQMELDLVQENLSKYTDKTGYVTLGGKKYYYSKFQPEPKWDFFFLTLTPAEKVNEAYALFKKRKQLRMEKVSLQLLIVSAIIFVVALFILQLLARLFTRPLSKLAAATTDVMEGHYEKVQIPKVSKTSKNEITRLVGDFGKMVEGLSDKSKIRAVLDKVVSKEIADEILKGKVELGGEVREACVLFADIRNFTHLSEKLPPEEVIAFINGFMNRMAQVIEAHQGVIDKYVGDAIMAIYGAPVPHKYSQLQAVISAILMIEALKSWNQEREAEGKFPISAGIGISYGEMVAGNVGAEDRLNYTVMGANAELAEALSDRAEPMEILLPEVIVNIHQIRTYIDVEEKGKGIYRVVGIKEGHTAEEISATVKGRDEA